MDVTDELLHSFAEARCPQLPLLLASSGEHSGGGGVGFSQWPAAGAYGATLRGLDKGLCQLKANRRRHPFPGWPGACSGLCCFRAPLGKG